VRTAMRQRDSVWLDGAARAELEHALAVNG
jgi:hypothetical protein